MPVTSLQWHLQQASTMDLEPDALQAMRTEVCDDWKAQRDAHQDDPRRVYIVLAPVGATQRQLCAIKLHLMEQSITCANNDLEYIVNIDSDDNNAPCFRCVPGRVNTDDPAIALAALQVELALLQGQVDRFARALDDNGTVIRCMRGTCQQLATCFAPRALPYARHLVTRPAILRELAKRAGNDRSCVHHSHGLINVLPNKAQASCRICGTMQKIDKRSQLCKTHQAAFTQLDHPIGNIMMEHMLRTVMEQYGGEFIDSSIDAELDAKADKAIRVKFGDQYLTIICDADRDDELAKLTGFFRPLLVMNKFLHPHPVGVGLDKVMYARMCVAHQTAEELMIASIKWREHLIHMAERMRTCPEKVPAFTYNLHNVPNEALSQHFDCSTKVSTDKPPKPCGLSLEHYHQLETCHNYLRDLRKDMGAGPMTKDEYATKMADAPNIPVTKAMPYTWGNSHTPAQGSHIGTAARLQSDGYPSCTNPNVLATFPKYLGDQPPLNHGVTVKSFWQWKAGTPDHSGNATYDQYLARVRAILEATPAPAFLDRIHG